METILITYAHSRSNEGTEKRKAERFAERLSQQKDNVSKGKRDKRVTNENSHCS